MTDSHDNLADQALANLVNQFARPLDFLRELAQNSIDAGSPRIEITLRYAVDEKVPNMGVLTIHVDDFGEGMDEPIIDQQLTRLFSSTKENDLTKIGKFGIGFTSIFAILPDAVLLRTGRHGEYWELLFHADRSFDKVRIDEPVAGTKITLYKRMPQDEVPGFVSEALTVLRYWCEHSDVPIEFRDLTAGEAQTETISQDPFAAFEATTSLEDHNVNRPMDIEAEVSHSHQEGETRVVLGYGTLARYGYYNGGLTLLNTRSIDALGVYASTLGHLSFKVKNDRLEHTLTRDNVLQDEHWHQVMKVILQAHDALTPKLIARVEAAVANGEDLAPWHGWLTREVDAHGAKELRPKLLERPLFVDHAGEPVTLQAIERTAYRLGHVIVARSESPLEAALVRAGYALVRDNPHTRQLLEALASTSFMSTTTTRRSFRSAEEAFVMPRVLASEELNRTERELIDGATKLLARAMGVRLALPVGNLRYTLSPSVDSMLNRITVKVGDFGGLDLGRREVLCLNGPDGEEFFIRPTPEWSILPALLRWRTLLVNRHHPVFRTWLLAAAGNADLAAFGLAQALLHEEGIEPEGTFDLLIDSVALGGAS